MEKLSYRLLDKNGNQDYLLREAPERILQFGEGNFLRAFVDYFVDVMNEKAGFRSKVVICQPIEKGMADKINEQEGLYTLYLRGFENGIKVNRKRIISCVSRCLNPYQDFDALMACAENPDLRFIVSNTTEAGIAYDPSCGKDDRPAGSYPGKLTQLLYRRFLKFGDETGKGFVVLSCELIDDNGKVLLDCVRKYARQWELGAAFEKWLEEENVFCSTLVDRIVTGFPKNEADALNRENGYVDGLLDTGEVFGFWVIEGPEWLKKEFPYEKASLPILLTQNHKPYKTRKVRILNGAHTSMVLGAYLAGKNIVRECMQDQVIRDFMNRAVYEEIIPTLELPKEELLGFAAAVADRFENPFIDHALLAIALNSTSKWKTRVLPSLAAYVRKFHRIPRCLSASLAFYITFYQNAKRDGEPYQVQDDGNVLEFFEKNRQEEPEAMARAVLGSREFWGEDLTLIDGLEADVARKLRQIREEGAYAVMKECVNG